MAEPIVTTLLIRRMMQEITKVPLTIRCILFGMQNMCMPIPVNIFVRLAPAIWLRFALH